MNDSEPSAEELLKTVVAQAVTATLKPAGFRKSSTNYHRRHGATVEVIQVQSSHGSTWAEKVFYINVGIAFDAVCELAGVPILDKPKEYECDSRGTRDRLGQLVSEEADSWKVRTGDDPGPTIALLGDALRRLVAELDRIDGPAAYRAHRWFDRFRPTPSCASILYLLDDDAGALAEVRALAVLFADRQNANRADWWIDRLNLTRLKAQA
jgi:hypothetical protein